MKGLALLAGLVTTLLISSAHASGDGICGFTDSECGMPALPYLLPDNDTRTNLMLLQSSRNKIALPIPQPIPDPGQSRTDPFTAYRVMGMVATEAPDEATSPSSDIADAQVIQVENAELLPKAERLHLPAPMIEKLKTLSPQDMEGRGISNGLSTLGDFFDVLSSDADLTEAQRILLAQGRIALVSADYPATRAALDKDSQLANGHAGDFLRYLNSAQAFYNGELEQADNDFQQLLTAGQPWVAETARYMLIRVAINQATQHALDEYDMFDIRKTDKAAGQRAVERIDGYLKQYPQGFYADSARGLYRRAYWMNGDHIALANLYNQALTSVDNVPALLDISNEIDDKLLENSDFVSSDAVPLLTLVQDLKRLRSSDGWMNLPALTQEEIEQQRSGFERAGMHAEFLYLQGAFQFYSRRDYEAVLRTLPAATGQDLTDTVAYSSQALRGLALDQLQRWPEAETHWRHLLTMNTLYTQQQFLQLALAQTLVDSGHPEQVFAANSPVKNLRFRSAILKVSADANLLRQQTGPQQTPAERAIALDTLLTKQLTHRDYAGYLKDSEKLAAIPPLKSTENMSWDEEDLTAFSWDGSDTEEGYQCPSLQETVVRLNKNPQDARAVNCLGEFFLRTGNTVGFDWGENNMLNGLTDAKTQYQGQEFNRLDGYIEVIANPQAPPEDKSYALYRAIYCYSPSGYNSCGSQDISKATRKAWFRQLKTEFKGSQWAEQLKYYW